MAAEPQPQRTPETLEDLSRRRFFTRTGFGALLVTVFTGLGSFLRFIYPNVLFEPPLVFPVGRPGDFPVGTITPVYDEKLYILHTTEGFIALDTTCTHLGCQTRWVAEDNLIECPCHGSKFHRDGSLVHGPAPRPLRRWLLTLKQGQLVVDTRTEAPRDFILRV